MDGVAIVVFGDLVDSTLTIAWCAPSGRAPMPAGTVEAIHTDTQDTVRLSCGFCSCASGYYRYDEGYTPQFQGIERFAGRIVHPQQWSEDIDARGGDRQRCHGGDTRPGDGPERRARQPASTSFRAGVGYSTA
jgi:hypothetical protein